MKKNHNNQITKTASHRNNNQPVRVQGLSIDVKYDNVDSAIRKFKRRVEDDGRLETVRNNQYYMKPSERKRVALKAAKARHRAAVRENGLGEKPRNM